MAIVKPKPIHQNIKKAIGYILNPEKTEESSLTGAVNCIDDVEIATIQFNLTYKKFPEKVNTGNFKKKQNILVHHYVQSFKKNEVSPEIAYRIAVETIEKVFKNKHQIVFVTHTNKDHIHNHILVNAINIEGERFYENKKSLTAIRKISDKICLDYGLSIIDKNKHKGITYKEWQEKQQGNSWKEYLKLKFEEAIIQSNSYEEFLNNIKKFGVVTRVGKSENHGKYFSFKLDNYRKNVKTRSIRNYSLGDEYSVNRINERIKNKEQLLISDYEFSKIRNKYITTADFIKKNNIKTKYVSLAKLISKLIDTKKIVRYSKYNINKPYSKENDYYINLLANQLNYLNKFGLNTEKELNDKYVEVIYDYQEIKDKAIKYEREIKNIDMVFERYKFVQGCKKLSCLSGDEEKLLKASVEYLKKNSVNTLEDLDKLKTLRLKLCELKNNISMELAEKEREFNIINSIRNTYFDEIKTERLATCLNKDLEFQNEKNHDFER